MSKKFIIFIVFVLVGLSVVRAQQASFQSKLLEEIGKSIGYVPNDTLSEGTYSVGSFQGYAIVAKYNNRHTVVNLGVQLFSLEIKEAYASGVYDFLERYFLELLTWNKTSLVRKTEDDKFLFLTGTLNSLRQIDKNTPFSIYKADNKYYEVSWKKSDGEALLTVEFPINFELLLGMPQVEIAGTLYDRIVGAPKCFETQVPDTLQQIENNVFCNTPLLSYQVNEVNNALYFKKEKDTYSVIVDTEQINYSALNVLQTPTLCNNPMKVEQSVYGFKTLDYTITLSQWINYCHSEGFTTYAAVEEEYDDALKVLVVAECKDLGYNHLMSVIVPRDFLVKPSAELKCSIAAFIPTHNVKNLYQPYVEKAKKKY